jgi:hypothetical protein
MPVKTEERARTAIARVGEGIVEKAWTLGRDPKTERKKRLLWGALQGVVAAAFTIAARRIGAKAWGVLTGEQPPDPPKRSLRRPSRSRRP